MEIGTINHQAVGYRVLLDRMRVMIMIQPSRMCLHLGPAVAQMADRPQLQALMLHSVLAQAAHRSQEIQAEECLLPQEVTKFRLEEYL